VAFVKIDLKVGSGLNPYCGSHRGQRSRRETLFERFYTLKGDFASRAMFGPKATPHGRFFDLYPVPLCLSDYFPRALIALLHAILFALRIQFQQTPSLFLNPDDGTAHSDVPLTIAAALCSFACCGFWDHPKELLLRPSNRSAWIRHGQLCLTRSHSHWATPP
jgi:hypothetical protein